MNQEIMIPVSIGELIDKITILEIKKSRISDKAKLLNINHELNALMNIYSKIKSNDGKITSLKEQLKKINSLLWDIEDEKRNHERLKNFDQSFVKLARSVYIENDNRAKIKKEINILLNSGIVEEKSYSQYN